MTDETRDAIGYLRKISEEWTADGLSMSASYLSDAADTLENELRRCRAEALREALAIIIDRKNWPTAAFEIRAMADEAEEK